MYSEKNTRLAINWLVGDMCVLMYRRAHVKPGETILIHGASGGVMHHLPEFCVADQLLFIGP